MPFDPNKPFKPAYNPTEQSLYALLRGVSPIPINEEDVAYQQNIRPTLDTQGRPIPAPGPVPSTNLNQTTPQPEADAAKAQALAERSAFQKEHPVAAYGLEYGPMAVDMARGIGKGAAKGLSKGADYLMQKATGMRKYIPGAGERLIEQGVRGTKSGMIEKIGQAMPKAEQEAAQALEAAGPAAVPSEGVSSQIYREAQKLVGPDGSIAPTDRQLYDSLMYRAGQVLDEEAKSPQATRHLRSRLQAGSRAKSGEAKAALDAQLAQVEAQARTAGLEKSIQEQSPEAYAQWRNAMEKERALIEAEKGLTKPESPASMFKPVQTGIGAIMGGAPGAAAGWVAGQPLTQSYVATGMSKLAKPIEAVASTIPSGGSSGLVGHTANSLEELLKGEQPTEQKPKFDPNKPFKPSK